MATPRRRPSQSRSGSKKKRSSKSKKSNNNGLLLGLAIGGGVALVAAVVIGVMIGRNSGSAPPTDTVADATTRSLSDDSGTEELPETNDLPGDVADTTVDENIEQSPALAATTPADGDVEAMKLSSGPDNVQIESVTSTEPPTEPTAPVAMDLPALIQKVEKSVVRIVVKTEQGEGIGSGFVIDPNGTLVTNYHVMEGAVSAVAEFRDGSSYPIEGFYKTDDKRDLAVLKINADQQLTALPVANELPAKGVSVATFGAPRGLSFSNSEGIVSALRTAEELKQNGDGQYIQTTAAISGGNSGGPLVNMYGEVVGANTFKRTDGESLNFAISCVDIKDMIDNRGTELTKVSPETIPIKIAGASGKYGGAENLAGTERGNVLLSQIREAIIITAPFNYDPSGRITDFVVANAERTFEDRMKWKSIRRSHEVKGSSALVFVAIYFSLTEGAEEDLVSDLNVHTVIVARDVDKDGNETRAIVMDEKGVVGTASIRTLLEGIVSRSMQSGTRSYFTKLVGQYRKATRLVGN